MLATDVSTTCAEAIFSVKVCYMNDVIKVEIQTTGEKNEERNNTGKILHRREGLTLETSASLLFHDGNFTLIKSFGTKHGTTVYLERN